MAAENKVEPEMWHGITSCTFSPSPSVCPIISLVSWIVCACASRMLIMEGCSKLFRLASMSLLISWLNCLSASFQVRPWISALRVAYCLEASCQERVFTPLAWAMKSGTSVFPSMKDLAPSHFFVSNLVPAPSNCFFSNPEVSKAFFSTEEISPPYLRPSKELRFSETIFISPSLSFCTEKPPANRSIRSMDF